MATYKKRKKETKKESKREAKTCHFMITQRKHVTVNLNVFEEIKEGGFTKKKDVERD